MLTLGEALTEWVTGITDHADAHWCVTNNSALGVGAAGARTRITALLIHAGPAGWALAVTDTFWSAVWRCADEVWQTRA